MDNYGMRKQASKWVGLEEEIQMVDRLYHDGFDNESIIEVLVMDFEYDQDEAEVLFSEIMQAAS